MLFLPRSANLNYLTGLPRDEPNFGNTIFPGEWLTGAWIPRSGAPILTLPRMLAEFHLGQVTGYDVRVLPDAGDRGEQRLTLPHVLVDVRIRVARQLDIDDHLDARVVHACFLDASNTVGRNTPVPAEAVRNTRSLVWEDPDHSDGEQRR